MSDHIVTRWHRIRPERGALEAWLRRMEPALCDPVWRRSWSVEVAADTQHARRLVLARLAAMDREPDQQA